MDNNTIGWFLEVPRSHYLLIALTHIITWAYTLTLKGWVSDDIEGIAKFSDRFIQEKDAHGNIIKEQKIDFYEVEVGGKKVKVPMQGKDPTIGWPNWFMRWWRINLGKSFRKIGTNSKGHTVYGYVQDARKHHAINIVFQAGNLLLGYNLLSRFFGQETALVATLLFAVHPCHVQTVGWISGINYVLSLFFSLVTFNVALYLDNPYLYIPAIAVTSYFSCMTLLPGVFNCVILLLLGQANEAVIAAGVGGLVLLSQGRGAVKLRINAFKEQNMGRSTFVSVKKLIVIVKTLWYYVRLVFFPKRLGLFHTWGYHYEEPIEHPDHEFWFGLLSIVAIGIGIIFGPPVVQFGLIWFICYLLIFSNIITAQQFVSERYAYISIFGFSLVAANYLVSFPIIVAFILGISIMRIWVHLPTFRNEVTFYESNVFNFPTSEVAMGNLGVSYLNHGMGHKALDTWQQASQQNSLYDVPWYNLYSLCKQNGDLQGAKKFLIMCLNAKTVHFSEQWKKEMVELERIISINVPVSEFTKRINNAIKECSQ